MQARILAAPAHEAHAAAAAVAAALHHPLLRAAAAASDCRRELPIMLRADDGTLIEGALDLAYRDADGWTVIDFKTDQDVGGRADLYRRQVALYARALQEATGVTARAVLLRV
jgi:ATP-dependent exoDNAse (exonuclease V) beta subunit